MSATSTTPETDEHEYDTGGVLYLDDSGEMVVSADLSRSLETRLRAAEARIKQLQAIAGHLHVAMYVDGKIIDECRQCGLDLRDPIHW